MTGEQPLTIAACWAESDGHEPGHHRPSGVRLAMSAPALRGEYLKTLESSEQALASAIAKRTGVPADDLRPRVLAAAVSGAVRVAVAYWLDHGPVNALPSILNDAIRSVVADHL